MRGSFWGSGAVSSSSLLLLGAGLAVVEPLSGVAFVALPAAPAVFCGVSCRRLPFRG